MTLALLLFGCLLAFPNGTLDPDSSFLIVPLSSAAVGVVVASRRSANPVGWLFLGAASSFALQDFARQYAVYGLLTEPGALPAAGAMAWFAIWPGGLGAILMLLILPLLFPDGRPASPRWRPVAWLIALVSATMLLLYTLTPGTVYGTGIANPLGVEALRPVQGLLDGVFIVQFVGLLLVSVSSLVARFVRSTGEERLQLKWIMYAASASLVWVLVNYPIEAAFPSLFAVLDALVFSSVPVAAGVAILSYRLYDIDLVINRTLVYGAMTACVVGIYVLVVGYLGALFRVDDNLAVSLVATGLVAVLFQPLRGRVQRGVNRLMYGERDEPYAAVSRLGERLEAALEPDAVPSTIVETVREALKLPHAAIALPREDALEIVAASGEPPGGPPTDPLVLPLSYGGETVGQLLLAPWGPGEGFSASDRRLLDNLARHAGVALHGVRAINDLRRSREGLVLAREEERRRLRRDLHDELAPTLAALGLTAATVGELIPTNPEEAASANEKLRGAIRATVGDVRRLVYDLRPPALDELGLVEAIKERATRNGAGAEGPRVTVEAPEALPPLPAAVEVAAYRIVQEALTNVSRHARASTCYVRFAGPDGRALEVEVTDDGVGLPNRPEGGVGLSSMRERAAELGGVCEIGPASNGEARSGTRIFARLPLAGPLFSGPRGESKGRQE